MVLCASGVASAQFVADSQTVAVSTQGSPVLSQTQTSDLTPLTLSVSQWDGFARGTTILSSDQMGMSFWIGIAPHVGVGDGHAAADILLNFSVTEDTAVSISGGDRIFESYTQPPSEASWTLSRLNVDGSKDVLATVASRELSFLQAGRYEMALSAEVLVRSYAVYDDIRITAVPEAGTWSMMGLGLGAIGVLMRRRVVASPQSV